MSYASASRPMSFDDFALAFTRLAMVAVFLPAGWGKLWNFGAFAEGLAPRGLPFGLPLPLPELWAVGAVAIEVGAPLLLLFGFATRWAALLLVAFTIMATLTSHRYWELEEAAARADDFGAFIRNMAYTGGLLALYVAGPGRFSVDYWRRSGAASRATA